MKRSCHTRPEAGRLAGERHGGSLKPITWISKAGQSLDSSRELHRGQGERWQVLKEIALDLGHFGAGAVGHGFAVLKAGQPRLKRWAAGGSEARESPET